jgi:hypothetical protein
MGSVNSIPVVSQVKSGVQLVCGDKEGAEKTQEQFFHECPVVSQALKFFKFKDSREKFSLFISGRLTRLSSRRRQGSST